MVKELRDSEYPEHDVLTKAYFNGVIGAIKKEDAAVIREKMAVDAAYNTLVTNGWGIVLERMQLENIRPKFGFHNMDPPEYIHNLLRDASNEWRRRVGYVLTHLTICVPFIYGTLLFKNIVEHHDFPMFVVFGSIACFWSPLYSFGDLFVCYILKARMCTIDWRVDRDGFCSRMAMIATINIMVLLCQYNVM
ncbi:hypothetical protein DAMA08_017640 [Martiniozyma asiatica (nom. inval.)]|nr:hypothetical protein DAMA08_017640 [Martiniozyma asiatica]